MISLRPSAPALVCAPVGRFLCMAAEAIAVLLICVPLFSQTNQGRIQGGVFDQTGGAIAGAKVTVTDVARGVAQTLTADSAGQYAGSSLVPSTYTVRGEAKGFRVLEHTGV